MIGAIVRWRKVPFGAGIGSVEMGLGSFELVADGRAIAGYKVDRRLGSGSARWRARE
jgi:hypothetical protein